MAKRSLTNKSTSHKHKPTKVVSTRLTPRKLAKGKTNLSIITSEVGETSKPHHQTPADHPLFGMRRYVHKNHNSCDPVLHVSVTKNLSHKNTLTNIKGCGNNKMCGSWFQDDLSGPVKAKVEAPGFADFANLLTRKGRRDKHFLMALAERWWDTTHTFHLDEIGVITMTPTDFSAITGLPISRKALQYDIEAHTKILEAVRLFGEPIRSTLKAKIKYKDIANKYRNWKP